MTQVENNDLSTEIPAWLALACAHKSVVWVDGKWEPIGIMPALKSPEWPLWKEAIEKIKIIGLLMTILWKEVPRSSVRRGYMGFYRATRILAFPARDGQVRISLSPRRSWR